MSITRTVVCRSKNQNVRKDLGDLSAYFSAPEPEGSARIGKDEPATIPGGDHVHIDGLTREEWDGLTPGQSYTLTIS